MKFRPCIYVFVHTHSWCLVSVINLRKHNRIKVWKYDTAPLIFPLVRVTLLNLATKLNIGTQSKVIGWFTKCLSSFSPQLLVDGFYYAFLFVRKLRFSELSQKLSLFRKLIQFVLNLYQKWVFTRDFLSWF
jgi:hypothetical protein